MKKLFPVLLLVLGGCSQPEAEVEPDYDNMVMDDEWVSDEEKDRKVVLADPPDPQERLLLENCTEQDLNL